MTTALFILSGLWSSACRPEAAPSPRDAAPPPAATAETPAKPPPPTVATPPKASAAPSTKSRSVLSFAIYTLSRGKGVPPAARDALKRARGIAETDQHRGVSVTIETTRIGLEGETRVCVGYKNAKDGTRAYELVRAIVKGIDLINLVQESCANAAPPH